MPAEQTVDFRFHLRPIIVHLGDAACDIRKCCIFGGASAKAAHLVFGLPQLSIYRRKCEFEVREPGCVFHPAALLRELRHLRRQSFLKIWRTRMLLLQSQYRQAIDEFAWTDRYVDPVFHRSPFAV